MFIPADVLDKLQQIRSGMASADVGIEVNQTAEGKPYYVIANRRGDDGAPKPLALILDQTAIELIYAGRCAQTAPPQAAPSRPIVTVTHVEEAPEPEPIRTRSWERPVQYEGALEGDDE